jgi:NAD(P)H-hydrate repair Nnr-like enzyme with NAD(P)H-hydrate dehydratase domain
MDEEQFFAHFPKKKENAYKGSYGKTLLIGGCFGMAGAVSLNIVGAKTLGAPYINCALPEEIYDIVSTQHMTTVFHPFGSSDRTAGIGTICSLRQKYVPLVPAVPAWTGRMMSWIIFCRTAMHQSFWMQRQSAC